MEFEFPRISELNRFNYNIRDLGSAKEQRAVTRVVKRPIHGEEGLSRIRCFGKAPIRGQAAIQPPSDEHRLADRIIVRQPPAMECRHEDQVATFAINLKGRFSIGGRLPTCPTEQ
jgi:hypothetical protein